MAVQPVGMIPKPQTRPHPPLVFGGNAKAALGRAARYGNGRFEQAAKLSVRRNRQFTEFLRLPAYEMIP